MARWRVQLTGEEFDLEELPKLFTNDSLRIVKDHQTYYLEGSSFDTLENAGQVREAAREMLGAINGAARLEHGNFKPVGLSAVHKIGPMGRSTVVFAGSAEMRVKASSVVVLRSGAAPPPPPPSPSARAIAAAQSSEPVRRALRFLGGPNVSWADLSKVIEVVQEHGGGRLIGTVVSKADIDRITQTANSRKAIGDDARHGHDKFDAPKRPFDLSEAVRVVHTLVLAWIG